MTGTDCGKKRRESESSFPLPRLLFALTAESGPRLRVLAFRSMRVKLQKPACVAGAVIFQEKERKFDDARPLKKLTGRQLRRPTEATNQSLISSVAQLTSSFALRASSVVTRKLLLGYPGGEKKGGGFMFLGSQSLPFPPTPFDTCRASHFSL